MINIGTNIRIGANIVIGYVVGFFVSQDGLNSYITESGDELIEE